MDADELQPLLQLLSSAFFSSLLSNIFFHIALLSVDFVSFFPIRTNHMYVVQVRMCSTRVYSLLLISSKMFLFMRQPIADASKLSVVITWRTACVYWRFIIAKPILLETNMDNGQWKAVRAVRICTCNNQYSTSLTKFVYLVCCSFFSSRFSLVVFIVAPSPNRLN